MTTKSVAVLTLIVMAALATHQPVSAGGGIGGIGGATEFTQLMNNIELVASVSQQASMVSEQIASKITLLQQYQTMQQNLKGINPDELAASQVPYQAQLSAFTKLQGSVTALRGASDNAKSVLDARGVDFRNSGMSMNDYLKYETTLANQRGGVYRQRLDQDIFAMDSMREKSSALRDLSQKTSGITGNVQGLQQLSQLSTVSAGELMEIKAVLLAQSADRNSDKATTESAVAAKATAFDATMKGSLDRSDRNGAQKYKFGDPFQQNWKNLEPQR